MRPTLLVLPLCLACTFGAKAPVRSSPSAGRTTSQTQQLSSLLAGGIAGSVSTALTSPIEVVKTQLQSSRWGATAQLHLGPFGVARKILEQEGPRGFFRGLSASLIGVIPARASYFWAYSTSRSLLKPLLGDTTPAFLLSGLAAGLTGNTITAPIWMVRTRMQLLADSAAGQVAYKGYRDAVRLIFKEEGFRGFYKGISASYWGCSEGAIQFVVYEKLKQRLETRHSRLRQLASVDGSAKEGGKARLPFAQVFFAASVSKLVATLATYPHEVVRTRLREQAVNGVYRYTGMWQAVGLIAQEEGWRGLYAGMATHIGRVVPNTAFLFLTYEIVNLRLLSQQRRREGAESSSKDS